jgi:hypothetical protein
VGSVKVRCVVKAVVKGGATVLSVAVGAESAEIVIVPDTWAVQDVLKQLVLNLLSKERKDPLGTALLKPIYKDTNIARSAIVSC